MCVSYTKALLSIPSGNRENRSRRALNPPHSYTIAFLKVHYYTIVQSFRVIVGDGFWGCFLLRGGNSIS